MISRRKDSSINDRFAGGRVLNFAIAMVLHTIKTMLIYWKYDYLIRKFKVKNPHSGRKCRICRSCRSFWQWELTDR
jgi:hypothetical protein